MNQKNTTKTNHIALYIGSLSKGGAERVFVNLAEYFAKRGYRVSFVTIFRSSNEYDLCGRQAPKTGDEKLISGTDIRYVPMNEIAENALSTSIWKGSVTRYYSDINDNAALEITSQGGGSRISDFIKRTDKLRRIWKILKPDLILSCNGKNNLMALASAAGLSIPVAAYVIAMPELEYPGRVMRAGVKILFPKAKGIILQTERSRAFFPKSVQKKAKILHNMVRDEYLNGDIPDYESRQKLILAVGRVDENKRHDLMIRAFARISKDFPDYRLLICGDGPDRQKMLDLAASLNISDKISMPGVVTDIRSKLCSASLFLHTSDTEGMPNALLEAMCTGLACIATDCPCGGPAMLIDNHKNGILIPVGDEDSLVHEMSEVLKDVSYAKSLGREALKIRDEYSAQNVFKEWEHYVEDLMN
ncbi:glycosyltransferase [Butyrivibrio fibrisolvens]|uniref:glycosyltransferase n=1 Tax=Butyrivibrio fibrisolvens TaxID=831 RepID=UPI0004831BD3|nr:glycosyltransferase [Butyrivibrio fibrisolvens]